MADGLVLQPDGLQDLNALLQGLDARTRFAIADALHEEMKAVMELAVELAPYEEGDLAGSGRVEAPRITSEGVTVDLTFGVDPYLDYAWEQHENLLYEHQGGKTAKFLEIPLLEWQSGGPEAVLDRAVEMLQ